MPYPQYAPDQLLPALRDYLVGLGLARYPSTPGTISVAGFPGTPGPSPLWLDPKKNIPYPGQSEGLKTNESHPTMVLAVYPATGVPQKPFEGFLVTLGAAIWYRGLRSPMVQTMHEQIRGALEDRRNYFMNGLQVNWSRMSREVQRIGSDERGYIYNCEVLFDMWSDTYVYA